jgi:osmotically-inducible protein OsmY
MRRINREISREGTGSSPPRFASEALPAARISPHQVEQEVRRALLSQPNLHFSSLVVRRIADGVCLQGILQTDAESPDVCSIAQRVAGVNCVLNHLLIAPGRPLPAKG